MITYSIANDTLNGKLDEDSLALEIGQAAIVPAIDIFSVVGDEIQLTFKSSLSAAEQTTLDGVIAAHEGISLEPEPQIIQLSTKTPQGLNKVAMTKPDGNSKTYISHNFCDKTTWPSPTDSVWCLDSVALNLGNLKVFKAEVQFTHDVIDAFNNDAGAIFNLDIMAGGARVDSDSKIFNNIFDIYDLGNKHYHTPAGNQVTMGGGINTVQFDYTDTINLVQAWAMAMKFFTTNNLEMPGTHCSVSLVAGPET